MLTHGTFYSQNLFHAPVESLGNSGFTDRRKLIDEELRLKAWPMAARKRG